jgi:hypothetical protein
VSYSGYAYVEAFLSQDQAAWTTAHVNAYTHFGGVTRILTPDYVPRNIIRYNEGGNPAYEGQGSAVGADPGGKILGQAGFGKVVVAATENGDEEICRAGFPGFSIDYGQGQTCPVDKHFLAGLVHLAHGDIDLAAPLLIKIAEPTVLVAFGVVPSVLGP